MKTQFLSALALASSAAVALSADEPAARAKALRIRALEAELAEADREYDDLLREAARQVRSAGRAEFATRALLENATERRDRCMADLTDAGATRIERRRADRNRAAPSDPFATVFPRSAEALRGYFAVEAQAIAMRIRLPRIAQPGDSGVRDAR